MKCKCGGDGLILTGKKLPRTLAEVLTAYVPCVDCDIGREHARNWTQESDIMAGRKRA